MNNDWTQTNMNSFHPKTDLHHFRKKRADAVTWAFAKSASTFSAKPPKPGLRPLGGHDAHSPRPGARWQVSRLQVPRNRYVACGLSGAELPPGKWQRRLGRPFSGGRGRGGGGFADHGGCCPATLLPCCPARGGGARRGGCR